MLYTKGKYLVGEISDLYSSNLGAVIIAENFGHEVIKGVFITGTIVSGGFFHIEEESNKVVCYGQSVSCGVEHNPQYDVLVAKALGLYEFFV